MRSAFPSVVMSIALAIHSGCFPEHWSPRAHKVAYVVDGAAALLGGALLVTPCPPQADDCPVAQGTAGVGLLAGAAIGALINVFLSGSPPPAPEPAPSSAAPELEQLATDAAAAARLGHCDLARASLRQIFHEDRLYFDEVVAAEPALRRCFASDSDRQ